MRDERVDAAVKAFSPYFNNPNWDEAIRAMLTAYGENQSPITPAASGDVARRLLDAWPLAPHDVVTMDTLRQVLNALASTGRTEAQTRVSAPVESDLELGPAPASGEKKPRWMQGNSARGFVDYSRHRVEHAESGDCHVPGSSVPECIPAEVWCCLHSHTLIEELNAARGFIEFCEECGMIRRGELPENWSIEYDRSRPWTVVVWQEWKKMPRRLVR